MNRRSFFKVVGVSIVALVSGKIPARFQPIQRPAPIENLVVDWRESFISEMARQIGEDMINGCIVGTYACNINGGVFSGLDAFIHTGNPEDENINVWFQLEPGSEIIKL